MKGWGAIGTSVLLSLGKFQVRRVCIISQSGVFYSLRREFKKERKKKKVKPARECLPRFVAWGSEVSWGLEPCRNQLQRFRP